jgi:adenosylmethionine-8-amino-7-oxononanoate aminotransferase
VNKAKKELLAQEIVKSFGISEINNKLNNQLDKLSHLNSQKIMHQKEIDEINRQLVIKTQLIEVLLHAKYLLQNGEKEE